MQALAFAAPPEAPEAERLRHEVRAFLENELGGRDGARRAAAWGTVDRDFSRKLGARGWIGMTWPKRYGGHERSALERYVVLEELLAAGAPVSGHWVADRQSGPLILRFGSEEQRRALLPRIAAGECFFCVGLSEPDTGSDLASVRTRASPHEGGWVLNGSKIWTSHAHHCDYIIVFCRTGGSAGDDRHAGMSQFIVDMKTPGLTLRPIRNLAGEHHFNEIHFSDVLLPADAIIGRPGDGWRQVSSELAFERSGPERFLSSFRLLVELVRVIGADPRSARRWPSAASPRMSRRCVASRAPSPACCEGRGSGGAGGAGEGSRRPPRPGDPGGRAPARRDRADDAIGRSLRRRPRPRRPPRALAVPARRHARDPARHHRAWARAALIATSEPLAPRLRRSPAR
jgi:hypothetical protein